jgi:DNA-binding sugar fermentation-stimulating protein
MVSQEAARGLLSTICCEAVWKSEITVGESRFDYVGSLPTGKTIYLEVKTAMVSLGMEKARNERRAVFPVGYKKRKGDPVSPRAIKHAESLTLLAAQENTHACYLVFLVPRSDCGGGFEVNREDPAYYTAVKNAVLAGVQVRAFALDYTVAGITVHCEVPVYIDLC